MTDSASSPSNDLSPRKGARVLVVEDGWQVADSLILLLEQMGMIAVGPAATSEDARRLATQCPLELAIVDVNLKGLMAGFTVAYSPRTPYGMTVWLELRTAAQGAIVAAGLVYLWRLLSD